MVLRAPTDASDTFAFTELSVFPAVASRAQRRLVLIVRHSIVYWAVRYTAGSGWGGDLGPGVLLQLHGIGQSGMRWAALLDTLESFTSFGKIPAAIVIQLGQNDLPGATGLYLRHAMREDLVHIHRRFPSMTLMWSGLLQRVQWRGAMAPDKVDLARRKACKAAAREVERLGGVFIPTARSRIAGQLCTGQMGCICRCGVRIFGFTGSVKPCWYGHRLRSVGRSGAGEGASLKGGAFPCPLGGGNGKWADPSGVGCLVCWQDTHHSGGLPKRLRGGGATGRLGWETQLATMTGERGRPLRGDRPRGFPSAVPSRWFLVAGWRERFSDLPIGTDAPNGGAFCEE